MAQNRNLFDVCRNTSMVTNSPQKSDCRIPHLLGWMLICFAFCFISGCGTTTQQLATEQLLMSDAVDQAISQIDFGALEGKTVFLDTLYLHSIKGVGFVNSEYIISSLRQQLTAARCLIQDNREAAEVIVEPRVGALGTNGHEVVYGVPQSSSIVSAASILSSSPLPAIPEISFGKINAQSGIAKIIVFAYDRSTREPLWQSGIAKSESTSSNTWVLGAGPFQKGSIHEGTKFAGQKLPPPPQFDSNILNGRGPFIGHKEPSTTKPPIVFYDRQHTFNDLIDFENAIPPALSPDAQNSSVEQAAFESPEKK